MQDREEKTEQQLQETEAEAAGEVHRTEKGNTTAREFAVAPLSFTGELSSGGRRRARYRPEPK